MQVQNTFQEHSPIERLSLFLQQDFCCTRVRAEYCSSCVALISHRRRRKPKRATHENVLWWISLGHSNKEQPSACEDGGLASARAFTLGRCSPLVEAALWAIQTLVMPWLVNDVGSHRNWVEKCSSNG